MNQAQARIAVIGGGPAGLMAAETLAKAGQRVDLFDAMPSVGRKFLLAGVGGMNLTHSEPAAAFTARYRPQHPQLLAVLNQFGAAELRDWAQRLGIETFVGSSGRVFPVDMKAAPLLRAWLHRLRQQGVQFWVRHRWLGWNSAGELHFAHPAGQLNYRADAVVLALGGASWPKLGSDGQWQNLLQAHQVELAPLQASNCGFELDWSPYLREHYAGSPLKSIRISLVDALGQHHQRDGEAVLSQFGLEGSLIYSLSSWLREQIQQQGQALIQLDLAPGRSLERLTQDLSKPQGSHSFSKYLKQRTGLEGVKAALLREYTSPEQRQAPALLAQRIKALPLTCLRTRPVAEAISSAGGIPWHELTPNLMLTKLPGVFAAGEMLDWEAPTGGYLLTGCFASGQAAGLGVLNWLAGGHV